MTSVRTEADCLLDQGALYKSRVLLRTDLAAPIFAGFKSGAFSLYFGDEPIFHFDLEGRWQRAYLHGIHYLKALDTTVRAIDRVREGSNLVLQRRTLGYAEVSDLDHQIRQAALDLIDQLSAGQILRVDPQAESLQLDSETLRDFLERVVLWDAAAWFAQRERYLATYPTTPFQPPDGVNRVVLQPTLGMTRPTTFDPEIWGTINPARPRNSKTTPGPFPDFGAHEFSRPERPISAERRFFTCRPATSALSLHDRSCVPDQRPLGGRNRFQPCGRFSRDLEGVHAFLEDLSETRPTREDWKAYRALHLKRVYLGVESGDPSIREMYGKKWTNPTLVEWVRDVKSAEINISLLVLDDSGGPEHAEAHQEATVALINQLDLGPGDIVALLDGSEVLEGHRNLSNLASMSRAAHLESQTALRNALRPFQSERKVKIVPYSLDKQWM